MKRATVILVGDELLAGATRDSNGAWLLERFADVGVEVEGLHVVGDDVGRLSTLLRETSARADLIVVSGGLGPTQDDRTRAALAAAVGVELAFDEGAWAAIQGSLATRGRTPAGPERHQAYVPVGGRWLENPAGLAPCVEVRISGARVLAFPGVPREWRAACELHVLAPLTTEATLVQAAIWAAGLREADVAARIEGLPDLESVSLASYPHDGEIELKVRGEEGAVEAAHAALSRALGPDGFHPPAGGAIEHAVVGALVERGLTVATAESVTGGLIARMLTGVPGASGVYRIGWVTYATEQKTAQLGVDTALIAEHGVVSEAVARAMAEGARARGGVDVALATTGTAGPGPLVEAGREPVPPGRVHVALAMGGRPTRTVELRLPPPRELAQRIAAVRALDLLRRALAASD